MQQALVLEKRRKMFTADGGHRSLNPEDLLQQCAHLVGPSRIVEKVECQPRDPCDLVHVCVAHPGAALRSALYGTRRAFRAPCVGKGMTNAQARASAIGEAVERFSWIFRGDEVRIRSSHKELCNKAIHPNTCMNFSARQYQEREKNNRREDQHNWVPHRFDEQQEIEWTQIWSLTQEQFKYIATAYCYFGYPPCEEHDFCRSDSNGNATGANFEEAILQGFLELVERDSVALWWYNRARRPGVDLESFGEPYFSALEDLYRVLGRDMVVLDITSDFTIPVFVALSTSRKVKENLIFGFGAHLEPRLAILRALTEMNQSLVQVITGKSPRLFVGKLLEREFLEPDPSAAMRTCRDYLRLDSEDLREDVLTCVGLARKLGMETLVLDLTRPDGGMLVVKVIVPGLRPWWARFAPGRLYDVPLKMGWRVVPPLLEQRLNPSHLSV